MDVQHSQSTAYLAANGRINLSNIFLIIDLFTAIFTFL